MTDYPLSWNEAVKAMRKGKIVETSQLLKYRMVNNCLEFFHMGDEWIRSDVEAYQCGEMIYRIVEEKSELEKIKEELEKLKERINNLMTRVKQNDRLSVELE